MARRTLISPYLFGGFELDDTLTSIYYDYPHSVRTYLKNNNSVIASIYMALERFGNFIQTTIGYVHSPYILFDIFTVFLVWFCDNYNHAVLCTITFLNLVVRNKR